MADVELIAYVSTIDWKNIKCDIQFFFLNIAKGRYYKEKPLSTSWSIVGISIEDAKAMLTVITNCYSCVSLS